MAAWRRGNPAALLHRSDPAVHQRGLPEAAGLQRRQPQHDEDGRVSRERTL